MTLLREVVPNNGTSPWKKRPFGCCATHAAIGSRQRRPKSRLLIRPPSISRLLASDY